MSSGLSQRALVLLAGGAVGGLHLLSALGGVPSLFLPYLPILLLLLLGLSCGFRPAMQGAAIALIITTLFSGLAGGIMFVLMIASPCLWYLYETLMLIVVNGKPYGWLPQGTSLTRLSYIAATMVAALTVSIRETLKNENLSRLIPSLDASGANAEIWQMAQQLLLEQPYLVLAATAWMQLAIFYGLAVLANFLLGARAIRSSLAITPFAPGGELLVVLLAAGLLSFYDQVDVAMAAKAVFITLLFPYFLQGLSQLHRVSLLWSHRRLLLTLVYVFMLLFPLLIVGFIGLGLAAQARHLSNRSRMV